MTRQPNAARHMAAPKLALLPLFALLLSAARAPNAAPKSIKLANDADFEEKVMASQYVWAVYIWNSHQIHHRVGSKNQADQRRIELMEKAVAAVSGLKLATVDVESRSEDGFANGFPFEKMEHEFKVNHRLLPEVLLFKHHDRKHAHATRIRFDHDHEYWDSMRDRMRFALGEEVEANKDPIQGHMLKLGSRKDEL